MKKIDLAFLKEIIAKFAPQAEALAGLVRKKADALLVVDTSADLKLLNIDLAAQVRISAARIIKLSEDKREEDITSAVRDFIRENNIQHKNAILLPSLSTLLIKRIRLPAMPDADLPEAIKWQLKDEVAYDLAGAVMDFSVISRITKEDDSKFLDIICFIAQEEEVSAGVLLLKQLGLKCLAVVPSLLGDVRLAEKYFLDTGQKQQGILYIGENNCYLVIYKESKIEFYRGLPVSINKLREALSDTLATSRGEVKLSAEEIGRVLFDAGIPVDDADYKDKLAASEVMSLLRPILEHLVQEMRRSFAYYQAQFQGGEVKKIFITGLAAQIKNIDKFLSREMSLEFSNISLADKIKAPASMEPKMFSQVSAAVGAALDYEKKINLLPRQFRTERFENIQKVSLRLVAFIAFLLLLVSYMLARAGVSAYEKRLAAASMHLSVLSEVKEKKILIDSFNNFISGVRDSDVPLGEAFELISNVAPRQLFINTLSVNCISRTGTINGFVKAVNQNPDIILTKFIRDMEASGYFKDVLISSVNTTNNEPFNLATYQVSFKMP